MKLIDVLGRAALVALTSGAMVVAGCSSHVSGSTGAGGLEDETPWAATNWGIPRRAERRVVETPAPAPAAKPAPRMTGCGNVRSTPAGYTWSGMAFPTGEAATSVLCVEKGLPAQVVLGQEFEYLIYVTNIGQADLNNVTVNDVTSAGWDIVSSTPSGRVSGNNMSWDLGTMGPGDQELITVRAKATQAGTIDACASATYNSSVCVATQVVQPSLLVTKSAPAEVLACDQIPIKIVVTNNGTGPARDVKVTDNLPAGMTVNGQQVVTLDAGTLAAGQSREFTLMASAARTGRFENKASASGSPNLAAESSATVTVVKKPVLTLVQECSDEMFLGRESEVKLTVRNTGDAACRGTTLVSNLPAGAAFASATDGGVGSGTAVNWALGEIAPGATKTVSYRYTSTQGGTFRTTSTVSCACAEPVSANCETVYKGIPAILVECIDVEDPDEVGTTDVYIIRVTNQGTAPGTGIRVVGEVPGQMSYESSSGATTGTANGRTITFAPLATLAPRATAEWRVVVMCNEPGDARFMVRVTSDQFTNPIQETESTTIYR
jgi:uncharacterized repeat protein (TIGR01451 family)